MKNIIFIPCLVAILFFTACTDDDTPFLPLSPNEILANELQEIQDQNFMPGFAVSVIKNDEIAFNESFGFADLNDQRPYQNNTTQPIASVSKTFIAVALMKAIDQGLFSLSTPINSILPFNVQHPEAPDVPILVEHLVSHTAGLVDEETTYNVDSYFYFPGEFENLTLGMQGIITDAGIQENTQMLLATYLEDYYTPQGQFYSEANFGASPGTEYEYSNIAASLAAYLIEVKSGLLYKDYVKLHILDPLNMQDSAFGYADLEHTNWATLYLSRNDPYPKYANHSYPDGFLHTSNGDLSKFLLEMIKGKNGQGSLLTEESYRLLFKRNDFFLNTDVVHSVFWELNDDRIEHSGGDPGVICFLSFDPINQTGYLFFTNIDTGSDLGDAIETQIDEVLALLKNYETA